MQSLDSAESSGYGPQILVRKASREFRIGAALRAPRNLRSRGASTHVREASNPIPGFRCKTKQLALANGHLLRNARGRRAAAEDSRIRRRMASVVAVTVNRTLTKILDQPTRNLEPEGLGFG